jgi:hypothetical protein
VEIWANRSTKSNARNVLKEDKKKIIRATNFFFLVVLGVIISVAARLAVEEVNFLFDSNVFYDNL